ncbi:enoyl-CoA hydratase/isomerase family protein [Flavobacterium piscisymbiosum]|uniref:Enoyl-CoA hydratase/isomerase family protein n=1 Tax=Flavobacterium piscisymbiosum TaxID=2893753 RepID=A0ABS8MDZ1_9FLAO|nr:enoyl-CoA hydratase/isomerase family protein [Flavobacterium sp. F-30]MCC9063722.1 enoyl-CoA hydratase/isomerase family protein [Flavobacterium sp. F-30]
MNSDKLFPNRTNLIDSQVLIVSEESPGYLLATIINPPLNLLGPEVFAGLQLLKEYAEGDNGAKVVVFESAVLNFFIAHLDLAQMNVVPDIPGAKHVLKEWPAFSHWLSTTPLVSIAKIRGRARGMGNEFLCALDMRFASRENSRLSQMEINFGGGPGGGGIEWLVRHVGRSRALEIILSGDDFDADTAELYGWINRSIPDQELDEYVDRLARRIAQMDKTALATAKQLINLRSPVPAVEDLQETFLTLAKIVGGEGAKQAVRRAKANGWGDEPLEIDLPRYE